MIFSQAAATAAVGPEEMPSFFATRASLSVRVAQALVESTEKNKPENGYEQNKGYISYHFQNMGITVLTQTPVQKVGVPRFGREILYQAAPFHAPPILVVSVPVRRRRRILG